MLPMYLLVYVPGAAFAEPLTLPEADPEEWYE